MAKFKKFFSGITGFFKKIYNSKEFTVFNFIADSIYYTKKFITELTEYWDHAKLMIAAGAIVGKHVLKALFGVTDKARTAAATLK